MIFENHEITYRNVTSKYYNVAPEEIDEAINDFYSVLVSNNYDPVGLFFYTIIMEADGIMTIELFAPIQQDYMIPPQNEQIYFRSYFRVNPMVMTRVLNNFDTETPKKHRELHSYMRRKGLEKRTPVFVEYKLSHENELYIEMSIGY